MASSGPEELSRLRRQVGHALSSFLYPAGSPVSRSGRRRAATGGSDGLIGDAHMTAARQADTPAGAVGVSKKSKGGTIFLDDERRLRSLAKEIKRLITEDKRRGIGV